ncbi:MAG: hypothetical protein JWQ45_3289 [Blastococcus sp.]|nr:hypothetical protein [Blastococcus sp.]
MNRVRTPAPWRRWPRRAQLAAVLTAFGLIAALAQQPVGGAFTGSTDSTGSRIGAATCFPGSATAYALADSTVNQAAPTTTAGADPYMIVASLSPANNRRAFVRFAMPSISAACTVTGATLRLYTDGADAGRTLGVYRVNPGAPLWTEAGLTWNNQPAPTADTPATAVTVATTGYLSWNVTALARLVYTGANNGFLVRDQAEGGSGPWQQYFARQNASPPKLDISWG